MGFALALGVVLSISSKTIEILTPLSDLSNVASLRFGSLRIDPLTGKEI
jgi:polynucleotide 5'-kinase involved in rRNA processing